MIKRACSSILLAIVAALAVACGDVEDCHVGKDPGCLNALPQANNYCLYDLVFNPVTGLCEKKAGSVSDNDACGGKCGSGTICDATTKNCVDFCAVPPANQLPGSVAMPEPIFCEAIKDPSKPTENPMLSFEEVCKRRCRLRCQRLSQFCGGYQCAAGSCDGQDVIDKCNSDCPNTTTGARDLACLTKSCNDIRFARCDTALSCPNNATPNCGNITCTNDCTFMNQGIAGDGICDDGDVLSSMSANCAWGSDCADCGPRSGAEPRGNLGAVCEYTLNCVGGTGEPDTSGAWCVGVRKTQVGRCMKDCSRNPDSCPSGFKCGDALFDLGGANPEPLTSASGKYKSKACLPTACN